MSSMSDDAMSSLLLSAHHLCQSTPYLGCCWGKVQHFAIKFRAKLMLFGDIPQGEMLLNHFMSSIYESNE
jgi:hypothetical protein